MTSAQKQTNYDRDSEYEAPCSYDIKCLHKKSRSNSSTPKHVSRIYAIMKKRDKRVKKKSIQKKIHQDLIDEM